VAYQLDVWSNVMLIHNSARF